MKINQIILLLAILALVWSNGLLISGRARRTITSSIAVIKLEIVGSDKLPSKSIAKAEAVIEKLKKGLKGVVQKQQIKTNPPQIELQTTNEGKVAFYETIIQIELTTNKNIGDVIEVADKFGTLIDVSYKVSDTQKEEVKADLVEQAFKNAEQKAQKYAQSIGVELDGVDLIQIHDNLLSQNDPSTVVVQVQVLYNLYNPNQQQEPYDTRNRIRDQFKAAELVTEDETQFQETHENGPNIETEEANQETEEIKEKEEKKSRKKKNEKE